MSKNKKIKLKLTIILKTKKITETKIMIMEPTLNTTTRIITALVVAWRTAAVWQDIVHPVAAGRRPRVISTVEIIKNHHCLTI